MKLDLLEKELIESHMYVRLVFQLLVGWFTFFLTLMAGALGWFAKSVAEGHLKDPMIIQGVSAFFFLQVVFGAIALLFIRRYFTRAYDRQRELTDAVLRNEMPADPAGGIAVHRRLMTSVVAVMLATLTAYGVVWVLFSFFV